MPPTFLFAIFFGLIVHALTFEEDYTDSNTIDESMVHFFDRSDLQRTAATAKFIDGQQGKSVPIMYETDYWYDIGKLMEKSGVKQFDQLCVQGVWLVYANTDFQASNRSEIGVVSGDNVCVDLTSYSKINSIQPVTSMSTRKADTLAFFPESNFNGPVWTLDSNHTDVSYTGRIPKSSSLILIGKQEWTLYPVAGEPVCISPQAGKAIRLPVCFVSKLKDRRKLQTKSFLQIVKGCSGEHSRMNIHFCMDYYNGKLLEIEQVAHKIKGRGAKEANEDDTETTTTSPIEQQSEPVLFVDPIKRDQKGCPVPVKFENVIDKEGKALLQTRLTHNLQSNVNLLWPKDEKKIWQLELLERAFNVVFITLPEELVPDSYLQLMREIYVYLWENKGAKMNQTFLQVEWRVLNNMMQDCNIVLRLGSDANVGGDALMTYETLDLPDDAVQHIDPIFMLNKDYDTVVELVWLIGNHVAATCHHALDFTNNFWTRFISIFQEMYLKPMQKQWKTPGKLANVYKYIFGGYGIENMHNKMGIATTLAVARLNNMDPFARWIDIAKGAV